MIKRKRMIKLLMAMGCDRNDAVRAADMCDGNNSHIRVLLRLIRSCCDMMYGEEVSGVICGILFGEQAGVWGYLWDGINIGADDFCSYGEPKEGAE